ncbi:tyrosine-type recombinase/integrase [Gilvimarinus agarilyticus]|uniref:tyrosine-type recombinase/integrase n=1 Tax=Gilvimarinus sp. 2_MG-2023 TaxID=3062666 RepID=UPI001C0A2A10|nr:tyrosine-type recombinase/integrase [Gilvimarinus sp. 2_MG-2023]MBU2886408.1 tyrosine-type recombinase/integrase [Gilvimarinus agarilyticus]MDO6571089.1 tyrosine-type recombinase/integrase [Gilvimarinus sp. 2_MG-2023]
MVHHTPAESAFFAAVALRRERLFQSVEPTTAPFPIQSVQIDWERLIAKRPVLLETLDAMPSYLLKPEVLRLLTAETHPRDRLILDLMWTTGAHTFRHSFAIRLLLHGRPLKVVSQLLRHRNVESTEVYTNVLTFDGVHFLDRVDFH